MYSKSTYRPNQRKRRHDLPVAESVDVSLVENVDVSPKDVVDEAKVIAALGKIDPKAPSNAKSVHLVVGLTEANRLGESDRIALIQETFGVTVSLTKTFRLVEKLVVVLGPAANVGRAVALIAYQLAVMNNFSKHELYTLKSANYGVRAISSDPELLLRSFDVPYDIDDTRCEWSIRSDLHTLVNVFAHLETSLVDIEKLQLFASVITPNDAKLSK